MSHQDTATLARQGSAQSSPALGSGWALQRGRGTGRPPRHRDADGAEGLQGRGAVQHQLRAHISAKFPTLVEHLQGGKREGGL